MQEIKVEVRPDFLERQAKAQPIQAFAELIWNGLDADATSVEVEIENDALGGISKIVVADSGHGMPRAEAPQLFQNLGGSCKRNRLGPLGLNRMLHGLDGRGRFKAFAPGNIVDRKVVHDKGGALSRDGIAIPEREIERVRISDEQPAPGAVRGVTVVISELKRRSSSLKHETAVQELSEIFAIHPKDHRNAGIAIGSEKIDPDLAIAGTGEFDLTPILDGQGAPHSVAVEIIEWRRQTRRTLYLCSEQGFPLSQIEGEDAGGTSGAAENEPETAEAGTA